MEMASHYETKTVTAGAGTVTFYDGRNVNSAQITASGTSPPGSTTATKRRGTTVPANAFSAGCEARPNSVKRYFSVVASPNIGLNVTLRFYHDQLEVNGNDENNLWIWHCEALGGTYGWVREAGTYTRDTSANWCR